MAALGTSRDTISKILNHKSPSVTAVYDRWDRQPEVRRALFAWGAKVDEIVIGQPLKVARIG